MQWTHGFFDDRVRVLAAGKAAYALSRRAASRIVPIKMLKLIRAQIAFALLALCMCVLAQPPGSPSAAVSVAGNVSEPVSLTVADLRRYPAHQIEHLPPGGRDGHKSGEAPRRYTGCLLRDVLAAAKPIETRPRELRKSYVVATASDGYEVVFSWAELFVSPLGDNVYIVYERGGAPLTEDEGPIALIVITDTRPVRHVKWLQKLALRVA